MFRRDRLNSPLLLSLLTVGVLSAHLASAEDAASKIVTKDSLLSDFFDPELKFAEGCGCYLRRSGAAKSDGLVFFGKLGDQKESGWISLNGEVMEVSKEKGDATRVEKGKDVRVKFYRSSDVTVQVELIQQQLKEDEETGTYTGELTVSSAGHTENIEVTGTCGC